MFQNYFNGAAVGAPFPTQDEAVAALTTSLKEAGRYAVLKGREEVYAVEWPGAAAPEAEPAPKKGGRKLSADGDAPSEA